MSDKNARIPPFSRGFMLREACPEAVDRLIAFFITESNAELAEQLKHVFVPLQGLAGSQEEFSFMAYPIPRLTLEDRLKAQVKKEQEMAILILSGTIKIQTDIFGKINWFRFVGLPEMYVDLSGQMKKPPSVFLP